MSYCIVQALFAVLSWFELGVAPTTPTATVTAITVTIGDYGFGTPTPREVIECQTGETAEMIYYHALDEWRCEA